MLFVPLNRARSPKLRRQTPVEDENEIQSQSLASKHIVSDFESNSSRSLSPYCRFVIDLESSLSYLDVPDTSNNSRRSSNNSGVRFTPHDSSDLCSILDMTVTNARHASLELVICLLSLRSTNPRISKRPSLATINTPFVASLIFTRINSISSKIAHRSHRHNQVSPFNRYRSSKHLCIQRIPLVHRP